MSFITRRDFLRTGLAAGAAVAVPAASGRAAGANEAIRLGLIGCGGRGNVLLSHFAKIEGVRIGGLCDPDQRRLHSAGERFGHAKRWADLREMLDDDSIDAVVIASAVHWHALATIWAVQAGKDVYCEKPMSHNLWETRQASAAVEQSGRIWQHGTQQQSDPMRAEIRRFLHDERALGKVLSVRVNRYDVRPPIGKRDAPLTIPGHIDYNLWLGPAQDMPVYRNQLQYDWHCHLANIAIRAGGRFSRAEAARVDDPSGHWNGAMEEMAGLLQAHGLDMENDSLRLSRLLTVDSATQRFVGEGTDAANAFTTRSYREPFAFPTAASAKQGQIRNSKS